MSARAQSIGKECIIITFTVISDPNRLVLIAHRLMPRRREIDDRQTPMAESNVPSNDMTAVIGTAMRNQRRHTLKQLAVGVSRPIEVENSRNSAHYCRLLLIRSMPQGKAKFQFGAWRPISAEVKSLV